MSGNSLKDLSVPSNRTVDYSRLAVQPTGSVFGIPVSGSDFDELDTGAIIRRVDMDLCCLIDSDERLSATDLVNMLSDLLERGMGVVLVRTI